MRNCTQPRELGLLAIVLVETEPAFRVPLPVPVIQVLQSESFWAEPPTDPVELLARSFQECDVESGTNDKQNDSSVAGCFRDPFLSPAVLFWLLAHYSEASIPLTGGQKQALAFYSLEAATRVRRCCVRYLMSTVTTDALDYCWYFLVHLMVIEHQLTARADARPSAQENIGLIHQHYSYLVEDLRLFHNRGWLTTESPLEDFESRLELGASEPRLKPFAARIIQDWEQIEDTGRELQFLAKVMGSQLHHEVENDESLYAGYAEEAEDIADSARQRAHVLHQMFCLERAMALESDDDQAWHHPLEYLESRAAGRHVIFLDTPVDDGIGEGLSNGQKFQLALLERMAARGFHRWLYAKPEAALYSIHGWLKDNGDSRSVKSLCDGVQRYLTWPPDRSRPSLRDLLMFQGAREPAYVTRDVLYWEELHNIKDRVDADVQLFMTDHDNEQSAAIDWMQPGADRKFIVIGNGGHFQDNCYFYRLISRRKSLVIRHRLAAPDDSCLSSGTFNLFLALRYAAYEVGRKQGWGVHQSAVLPIQGNQRFLAAFKTGELQEAASELKWQFLMSDSRNYEDAVIFTDDEDGHEKAPSFEPNTADSRAPLVGAGN